MIIRYSLPIDNINEIDLYIANIEIYLLKIILYLGYFNIPKSVLYMKNLATSQQIIPNKNIISQRKCLITSTLNLKYKQIINKIYKIRLPTIKISIMIKI